MTAAATSPPRPLLLHVFTEQQQREREGGDRAPLAEQRVSPCLLCVAPHSPRGGRHFLLRYFRFRTSLPVEATQISSTYTSSAAEGSYTDSTPRPCVRSRARSCQGDLHTIRVASRGRQPHHRGNMQVAGSTAEAPTDAVAGMYVDVSARSWDDAFNRTIDPSIVYAILQR